MPRHRRSTGRLFAGEHAGQAGSGLGVEAQRDAIAAFARAASPSLGTLRSTRRAASPQASEGRAAIIARRCGGAGATRPLQRAGSAVLGGVVAISAGLRTRWSNEAGHFRNSRKVDGVGERDAKWSVRAALAIQPSFAELAQERGHQKARACRTHCDREFGPVVVRRGGKIFGDVPNSWRLSETATRDTIDMPCSR